MASIKSFNSLEITGSFLEVPPPKEPNTARPIDKKRINPIEIPKKKSASLYQVTKALNSNRSISQLSNTQTPQKKNSIVSLSSNSSEQSNKIYEDEIQRLKKRIEELEGQYKNSQKANKEKEKIIDDLSKKLNASIKQENLLNNKITDSDKEITSLKDEIDSLNKQLEINEELIKFETDKAKEELYRIKLEQEDEIKRLKDEHCKEMKIKEEKLDNLKKQIAGAFKDNSWERQLQIDELTRELKRVQEESDLIKHKLKGYKNKFSDSCTNCSTMHEKLEEKILSLRDKDNLINDLVNLMKKFQNQLNFQEELIKIVNSNKNLNDSLTRLCFNLKQGSNSSAVFKNKK